jgi:hypothetical protein
MSTNYYLHEKPACSSCGRTYEALHIGKSSGGWCFSLHVIPEDGLNDLPDWVERWSRSGSLILDEYDRPVTPKEMLKVITERRRWSGVDGLDDRWYQLNHAVPGPYGLVRHAIGQWCVGHGEGTWDLIPGEFS